MPHDRRRLDMRIAPLAVVTIILAMAACGWISAERLDHIYLFYAVAGLGLVAGVAQWQSRRAIAADPQSGARNTLTTQLYGLVILTAVCCVPAILVGRALGGVDLLTGE